MLEPLLGAHQAPQGPRSLLLWPLNLAPLVWAPTLSCERPAALARAWTRSESYVQWMVGALQACTRLTTGVWPRKQG